MVVLRCSCAAPKLASDFIASVGVISINGSHFWTDTAPYTFKSSLRTVLLDGKPIRPSCYTCCTQQLRVNICCPSFLFHFWTRLTNLREYRWYFAWHWDGYFMIQCLSDFIFWHHFVSFFCRGGDRNLMSLRIRPVTKSIYSAKSGSYLGHSTSSSVK